MFNDNLIPMKVISLLQPWASLVVLGHKLIETRSWDTNYRGPLLIHASQKFSKETARQISEIGAFDLLADPGYDWKPHGKPTTLPLGAIIGMVNLVDTFNTNDYRSTAGKHFTETALRDGISPKEEAFGDYSRDRFAWMLSDCQSFKTPIPAKGKLQLWNLPEELLAQVQEQMSTAL